MREGATWYPTGYYGGIALNMTSPEWEGQFRALNVELIDRLAANGINLMRAWINWGMTEGETWSAYVEHPYQRPGPGLAADGKPRFDVTKFNPAYFELLQETIAHARDKGIVVQVLLLDCFHVGDGVNLGMGVRDYFYATNNVNGYQWSNESQWLDPGGPIFARNMDFVEKVIETIGNYPNIVWETCNEKRAGDRSSLAATAADQFHSQVARRIRAKEAALGLPRHLVMPVDLPEHRTVAGHVTHWPKSWAYESIEDMRSRLSNEQRKWNVPLISDNDCCDGEPDPVFMRRKAWGALTAGAHMSLFNDSLYQRSVMRNAETAQGMTWMGLVRRFIEDLGIDLAGMQPADALASSGWVLAKRGVEYIVYLPSGGRLTLTGLPASYTSTWFDPRTGVAQPASGPVFRAPDGNDWVLHVRAN